MSLNAYSPANKPSDASKEQPQTQFVWGPSVQIPNALKKARDFSYANLTAYALVPERYSGGQRMTQVLLTNLNFVGLSTHRDVYPVVSSGQRGVKGFCLPETAQVLVRGRGLVSIKDVGPGDWVEAGPSKWALVHESIEQADPKDCVRIHVEGGIVLEGSTDHPIMTESGWRPMGALSKGDVVAANGRAPSGPGVDVPDDALALVATLIGDGTLGVHKHKSGHTSHNLSIAVGLSEWNTVGLEIRQVLDRLGISYSTRDTPGCRSLVLHITKGGRGGKGCRYHDVHHLLKEEGLYGLKAPQKRIPDSWVGGMDERQTALFLRYLFATDGGYTLNRGRNNFEACYVTTSKVLAEQVRVLLWSLGIPSLMDTRAPGQSRVCRGSHSSYCVKVSSGLPLLRFVLRVGISGKDHKVEHLVDGLKRRINRDVLDLSLEELAERARGVFKQRGLFAGRGRGLFKRLYAKFQMGNPRLPSTPRRAFAIADELGDPETLEMVEASLRRLVEAPESVVRRRVLKVEQIGPQRVWDLSVPETECFVANRLMVHNTMGHRVIAGTLGFVITHENPFADLIRAYSGWLGNAHLSVNILPDELPPFDLVLVFHGDGQGWYADHDDRRRGGGLGGILRGAVMAMVVRGVKILDGSKNIGVRDIALTDTYSFMAMSMTELIDVTDIQPKEKPAHKAPTLNVVAQTILAALRLNPAFLLSIASSPSGIADYGFLNVPSDAAGDTGELQQITVYSNSVSTADKKAAADAALASDRAALGL